MPTYGKNNFKESNVNYLNKDFASLKTSLMNYAKSYFPDTYRDFNETSPGMMLIEMNAYVGDVLSFYIDQQYQEMLLPLAEERKNIITMAKMFGYKVKPIVPAYVNVTFKSNVNASSGDTSKVDYSNASVFDSGIQVQSSTNSDIIFTTLEPVDFKITGSDDTETISTSDESGLASTYELSRTVKAVSAIEKTITFQVGIPEKFKTLTIPDTNVIDIISCVDSNGNDWYEVDFLAQDKVPISTHYTDDDMRGTAYDNTSSDGLQSETAVPFSLTYRTTPKRFTRETNQNNTTSLVFGNGILRDGNVVDTDYIDLEQIGIVIPGQSSDLNDSIDPLLGNEYSTLGETPNNITLTITYRVGGGINSNVPSGDLTTVTGTVTTAINGGATLGAVTNDTPARGGKDEEDTIEIKEKAKAFFSTQNRCVTKEDYEARVLNIPAKFGNIAKAYVTREAPEIAGDSNLTLLQEYTDTSDVVRNYLTDYINGTIFGGFVESGDVEGLREQLILELQTIPAKPDISDLARELELGTINIYALAYNNSKQLVGNPHFDTTGGTNNLPPTLTSNIKKYLENFKLLTDFVTINDGYVVNFGVIFDIIAEKYANKQKVKLDCIQKIKDYFRIEKMQFNQPIFKSNLEFELMGVEGVRSIGHVTITQKLDYNSEAADADLNNATYTYSKDNNDIFIDQSGENGEGSVGYGYKYNFEYALSEDKTIIRPPELTTPTVFELKNPNQNIQGRVR